MAQQVEVVLPASKQGDASGRLLVFAKPSTPGAAAPNEVDASELRPTEVSVAARDVDTFGVTRRAVVDVDQVAEPRPFSALPSGEYWMQVVLDQNRDYARYGRGPGDIISHVVTVRLPLEHLITVQLDHLVSEGTPSDLPLPEQERLSAERPFLTDFAVRSAALSRFWGRDVSLQAWVLVPPTYYSQPSRRWPVVYLSGAYSANYRQNLGLASSIAQLNRGGQLPPMIWVILNFSTETGTTQFADSVNNGPWGQALTEELIPALEHRFRMYSSARARFLIGHSSGGGASIWLQARYPSLFGGAWATAPDPTDFHDFVGVDLYAPNANMYYTSEGSVRPLIRVKGEVTATLRDWVAMQDVLGTCGSVFRSYDWDFSPRGPDGTPLPMFNHVTGTISQAVVKYWREHYDVAYLIETMSPSARRELDGKLHVIVGTEDTYYLDGSVHLLKAVLDREGIRGHFTFAEGKNHNDLYQQGADPFGLLEDIAREIYSQVRTTH